MNVIEANFTTEAQVEGNRREFRRREDDVDRGLPPRPANRRTTRARTGKRWAFLKTQKTVLKRLKIKSAAQSITYDTH